MSTVRTDFFTTTIALDLFDAFVGEKIGEGIARHVFAHELDADAVVKIETRSRSFQNMVEWQTWQAVKEVPNIARWFAPCLSISPCGIVLIQKRAADVTMQDVQHIKRLPDLFTDLKPANWGRIGSRIVCRDYGVSLALSNGITAKTRKADWWE